MSVFVTAGGIRMIECNICGAVTDSIHGLVINGSTNDVPPSGWNTEILQIPCGIGYNWKRQHFCPNCQSH